MLKKNISSPKKTSPREAEASLGGVAVGYGLAPSGILGLLRTSRRAASSCGVLRVIQSNQPPESSSSDSVLDFFGSEGSGFQSSRGVKLRYGIPSASLVKASDLMLSRCSSVPSNIRASKSASVFGFRILGRT